MTVRRVIGVVFLTFIAGCSQPVQVPTEAQFEQSPNLLSAWMIKCQSGEYSNLGAEEKQRMCGSAQQAANVLLQREAARKADDSFSSAILSK
ncbi:hypothetical protein [Sphingomonas bacterium]|uniref:hypothetical protein n=1 Tax=Sphingomonas bacterium TaxID=1895847 RepID=UPI001576A105|nr:hypothetical protein [Sphingomonas bacterium]